MKPVEVEWVSARFLEPEVEIKKIVREYVYYSIIRDIIFTLTTPPLHEAGEVVVGVLFLGEL